MRLKAIIFDVDGTLAETEEAHRRAFNRAFAEAGLAWRWSEADYAALLTTTGGRERIGRYRAEIGLAPDATTVAALHMRKNEIYAEQLAAGEIESRPGIMRLIRESLDRGVTLAIATTTSRANLDGLLRHVLGPGSETWFPVIVAGEDVAVKKPDPEVYSRALAALGLEPEVCVAIEDSKHGLAAARAAGIATVVTPSRFTSGQDFSAAALVCSDLDQAESRVDLARLDAMLR
ncbi:HAD-IA family hydrolase [Novosphingobium sp.]|uniref:HAD-IA family hydrolase n=1 Tax=Novosphingobium sp. TaxID=1874826 RepID=UPI0025E38B3A|nr:HAD-IA family hydrolase [Novosphingobium sp.]